IQPTAARLDPAVASGIEPSSRWLDSVKAPHRQFFDAPQPEGGIPLIHVMNYYETLNKAFSVKDTDIDGVLTFYGETTFYGVKDESGAFAVANPWRVSPTILGMSLPQASIESLKKRGATFILCNNALGLFSGMVAAKQGLDAKTVHEEMKANLVPGVELIPGM